MQTVPTTVQLKGLDEEAEINMQTRWQRWLKELEFERKRMSEL